MEIKRIGGWRDGEVGGWGDTEDTGEGVKG
jgi:hypothetical protein